jgi:uncharacterized membrane protein
MSRIFSIDLLRGIVILLMSLDHYRWFFHAYAGVYNPTNLGVTTPAVFFTRWVTHFCGPVFIFLAGLSAGLYAEKRGVGASARFLWTRALWLIFLEFFVLRLGWDYHYLRPSVDLLIIWVIGASMLFLAAGVWLPRRWVLAVGLFILFAHNLLQGVQVSPDSQWYNLWVLAYRGGGLKLFPTFRVGVLWAFLPYVGVIMAGCGTSMLFRDGFPAAKRRKSLILAGITALALFVLLRTFNLYGDPNHWSTQKSGLFSAMSFINTTKYPTSLLYALMTLGPAMIALAFFEKARGKVAQVLQVFGRVPLFYFILHLFLGQATALLSSAVFAPEFGLQKFNLASVYLAWIALNVLLYPLCVAFGRYKTAHPEKWWLRYL